MSSTSAEAHLDLRGYSIEPRTTATDLAVRSDQGVKEARMSERVPPLSDSQVHSDVDLQNQFVQQNLRRITGLHLTASSLRSSVAPASGSR